ncbi:MAG: hypothetical protein JOZ05_22975 [Acetobacteraceae bacterium]|nr:hypothetical protein [Acetobacteraceae bacterium]
MVRKLLLVAPLLASCAAMQNNTQGPMQPQSVSGPCQVGGFFFLGGRSVPTQMTVANTGQACTVALINPALNAPVNAVILNGQPAHGQATAGVIGGGRQAGASYVPQPGYVGPDQFRITIEPGAVGVTFNVVVQPGR